MGLDLHEAEFLFHSEALDGSQLLVHQFSGRESLSQPFEFLIALVSKDANLDLDAPIGEAACLTLRGRLFDGSRYSRYVHGVIERFVLVGAGSRQSRYQAKLVPTLKQLFFTRNSRIFQKSSGPSVTQQVLKQARVPSDWVSTMLHGIYSDRDYCVQYQESDLDFVSRLWEEEGIFRDVCPRFHSAFSLRIRLGVHSAHRSVVWMLIPRVGDQGIPASVFRFE